MGNDFPREWFEAHGSEWVVLAPQAQEMIVFNMRQYPLVKGKPFLVPGNISKELRGRGWVKGAKPLQPLDSEDPEPREWVGGGISECRGACSRKGVAVGAKGSPCSGFCRICWARKESRRISELQRRDLERSRASAKICRGCGVTFLLDRLGNDPQIRGKASKALEGFEFHVIGDGVYSVLFECPICGESLADARFVAWGELAGIVGPIVEEVKSRPKPLSVEERLELLEEKLKDD